MHHTHTNSVATKLASSLFPLPFSISQAAPAQLLAECVTVCNKTNGINKISVQHKILFSHNQVLVAKYMVHTYVHTYVHAHIHTSIILTKWSPCSVQFFESRLFQNLASCIRYKLTSYMYIYLVFYIVCIIFKLCGSWKVCKTNI